MLSSTELIAAFDEAEERLGGEKATPLNMYCEGFFKGVEVGKADLLGHSGLEYVERYVRAIDESKRRALNSLPKIEL